MSFSFVPSIDSTPYPTPPTVSAKSFTTWIHSQVDTKWWVHPHGGLDPEGILQLRIPACLEADAELNVDFVPGIHWYTPYQNPNQNPTQGEILSYASIVGMTKALKALKAVSKTFLPVDSVGGGAGDNELIDILKEGVGGWMSEDHPVSVPPVTPFGMPKVYWAGLDLAAVKLAVDAMKADLMGELDEDEDKQISKMNGKLRNPFQMKSLEGFMADTSKAENIKCRNQKYTKNIKNMNQKFQNRKYPKSRTRNRARRF